MIINRLTKDNDTQYDLVGKYDSNSEEFIFNHKLRHSLLNKLGELEDIEEELGCPLRVLWKLRNAEAITIKGEKGEFETWETDNFTIDLKNLVIWVQIERSDWIDSRPYYFKDYTKTWWLKENLEE